MTQQNSEVEIRTTAALRLIGSKEEILMILAAFARKGFIWKTNGKYYPQRDNPNKFAYYLNYFYFTSINYEAFITNQSNDDDPKPGLFDAVLGGKK